MASSLESLPPEMLNQIIAHIHENGHLLNLALCCRSFHDLAIPYLYAHITLKVHKAPIGGGHYHPGLRALTSRLMGDPALAANVRSITFPNAWNYNKVYGSGGFNYLVDDNSDSDGGRLIRNRVVGSCKQEFAQDRTIPTCEIVPKAGDAATTAVEETSVKPTEQEYEDMHIAMLLLAVPNFETLDIVSPCFDPDQSIKVCERALYNIRGVTLGAELYYNTDLSLRYFQRALNKLGGATLDQRPFQHLKVVACSFNKDQDHMLFVALLLLLRLSSIREILLQTVMSCKNLVDKRIRTPSTSDLGQSTVERLELRNCNLGDREMEAILCSCTSIKTFVYDFDRCALESYWDESGLSMLGLRKALYATEVTVENLWIDYADLLREPRAMADDVTRMSSVSQFEALKNLKLGMFVAFGVNTTDKEFSNNECLFDDSELPVLAHFLPQSLETIYISHTNGRLGMLVRALEHLLQVKWSCVPRLREIAIEAFLTGNDQAPSLSKLSELAEATGVELRTIDGATVKVGECELDWTFQSPRPLNLGQGWDGSVTWASAFDSDHRLHRFLVEGKHS